MPTATVLTFGCKVNQFESQGMAKSLLQEGYTLVFRDEPADLRIINTCTVTHKADLEARSFIRRVHRNNPSGLSVVTGCYAQTRPEELIGLPGVMAVLGQEYKNVLLKVIDGMGPESEPLLKTSPLNTENSLPHFGFPGFDRTRAFFRIQDGCSACCTYCAVPQARGPSRSLETELVLEGLSAYEKSGYQEVVLSGIHLGAWGLDLSPRTTLVDLLGLLINGPYSGRLRLSSIEPHEVTSELIQTIRQTPRICTQLHLPLQSGDDQVLARMRRPYTSSFFQELVYSLTSEWPELCLGVDVMAGFPGEDEQAFSQTRDLILKLPLAYLHVFPYSKRPGTQAAKMPGQVDPKIIKSRAASLREIGHTKRNEFYKKNLGLVRPTLIENTRDRNTGLARGLTDNYIKVLIPEPAPPEGSIAPVRLTDLASGKGMVGRAA
ncbi:MAG: tRNA (N(6)-L-threonylcarbamoyladenosine(37)-C(2))-methylthiotransferase MtaB [Candidatus Adiutricales bacterium]